MSALKVTFKEDLRTIKKNAVFEFDFDKYNTILIAGPNGCGKSTLINCIRGSKCNNKEEINLKRSEIMDLANNVEVETSFEHIYYLSSEYDDPFSMDLAYDAWSFVESGGFHMRAMSNGQKSLSLLNKFMGDNFGGEINIPENSLIILDEVDRGFDLAKQVGMHNLVMNISKTKGVKILYVCHTPIPLMLSKEVYYFNLRMMIPSKDYIYLETNLHIDIHE